MSVVKYPVIICSFQFSPDPTYAEIKKPQPLFLQNDHVPPPIPPYLADDYQPPSIPLFNFEDKPSISPVISQYSVIMREHMTPHVQHYNTVARGDDSTQSLSKKEEIKVIKQISLLN